MEFAMNAQGSFVAINNRVQPKYSPPARTYRSAQQGRRTARILLAAIDMTHPQAEGVAARIREALNE